MSGNLVIVCSEQEAETLGELMQEYGSYQTRLASAAWYLNLDIRPEDLQETLLGRLGRYATLYIFEASSVTYNTSDAGAAETLDTRFGA
jgi:hypothetical protein